MPTQPGLQLGGGDGVELKAIIPGIADVRVQREFLAQRHTAIELGGKFFAQHDFSGLPGQAGRKCGIRGKIFLFVVSAAEYIEYRVFGFDHVIPQAAAQHIPQVEILELVVFEIRESKYEPFFVQVEIAAQTATNRVRRGS